jgi:hypothetical protein
MIADSPGKVYSRTLHISADNLMPGQRMGFAEFAKALLFPPNLDRMDPGCYTAFARYV